MTKYQFKLLICSEQYLSLSSTSIQNVTCKHPQNSNSPLLTHLFARVRVNQLIHDCMILDFCVYFCHILIFLQHSIRGINGRHACDNTQNESLFG